MIFSKLNLPAFTAAILGALLAGIYGWFADVEGLYGDGWIWLIGVISSLVVFYTIYNIAQGLLEEYKFNQNLLLIATGLLGGIILGAFLSWGVILTSTSDLGELDYGDWGIIMIIAIIIGLATSVVFPFFSRKPELVNQTKLQPGTYAARFALVYAPVLTICSLPTLGTGLAFGGSDAVQMLINLIFIILILAFILSFLMIWLSLIAATGTSTPIFQFYFNGFIFAFLVWFMFDILIFREGISMVTDLMKPFFHAAIAGFVGMIANGLSGHYWSEKMELIGREGNQ